MNRPCILLLMFKKKNERVRPTNYIFVSDIDRLESFSINVVIVYE